MLLKIKKKIKLVGFYISKVNTLCNYGYYIHKKQTLNIIEIQVKHKFVLNQFFVFIFSKLSAEFCFSIYLK